MWDSPSCVVAGSLYYGQYSFTFLLAQTRRRRIQRGSSVSRYKFSVPRRSTENSPYCPSDAASAIGILTGVSIIVKKIVLVIVTIVIRVQS